MVPSGLLLITKGSSRARTFAWLNGQPHAMPAIVCGSMAGVQCMMQHTCKWHSCQPPTSWPVFASSLEALHTALQSFCREMVCTTHHVSLHATMSALQAQWPGVLERHGAVLEDRFDMSTLAHISDGYSSGTIDQVLFPDFSRPEMHYHEQPPVIKFQKLLLLACCLAFYVLSNIIYVLQCS